jgi:hypothetical protein
MDRLLATPVWDAANQRLARHLRHEQPHLFTFLPRIMDEIHLAIADFPKLGD